MQSVRIRRPEMSYDGETWELVVEPYAFGVEGLPVYALLVDGYEYLGKSSARRETYKLPEGCIGVIAPYYLPKYTKRYGGEIHIYTIPELRRYILSEGSGYTTEWLPPHLQRSVDNYLVDVGGARRLMQWAMERARQ